MGRTPAGETRERVFEFVRERLLQGLPPTIREVQNAFGFRAVETARAHLEALVQQGRLAKSTGRSRGYQLPEDISPGTTQWVPLLGRVQAGALSTAVEDLEGYIPVESHPGLMANHELFALRVFGESMIGAGILDGDIVIVRRQPAAQSGEIVVALVEDEATVKRLKLRNERAELHPENTEFDIIIPPRGELNLLGKVIEVRRYLHQSPIT